MSGWIFVDKDKDSQGQMRENMRRNMRRGGYRNYGGSSMRENYMIGLGKVCLDHQPKLP